MAPAPPVPPPADPSPDPPAGGAPAGGAPAGGTIRLLGRPRIERAGAALPAPRGNKAWGLLAHLVLTERPAARSLLVSLLFAEAEDPLRALRWNLSELRRALRGLATVDGDPLALSLAPGCEVDVRQLTGGDPSHALVDGLGQDLLAGMDFPTAPSFEAWLAAERRRVTAVSGTVLLERALDLLAAGSAVDAARLAARAVALDPLEAGAHAVLVRSLTAAGDHRGARRQVERCTDLFRRELGCLPPAEVAAAAWPAAVAGPGAGAVSAAVARSYLEAGRASLTAGAVDRGLDQLRRAAATAVQLDQPLLQATALLALAAARVHSAGERGTAVQGLLHEAAALARAESAGDLAASACRELGFLAVQRGHPDRALVWLEQAGRLATDDGERARITGVRGMCLSDGADFAGALAQLDHSVELAGRVGDGRQGAWSLSMVGRVHVRRGDHQRAAAALDRSLEIAGDLGWTAFRPWPAAFRAEAAIGLGDLDGARELLDAAWVLATESGDHCWLATVAGSQAVLALAEGDDERGREWCRRGLSPAPWYLWPRARLLDLACSVALRTAPETAGGLIDALTDLAGRGCMTDLLVAAHLHRAHAGSPTALAAAQALAAGLDDPVLRRRLQWAS